MDTKSDIKKAISAAIVRLLRPLCKILLAYHVPYGTFADLAKWAYVDVASKEFGIPGRKVSSSRVSILTGLPRKEVTRLKEIAEPHDLGASERLNRAVRVIGGWLKDPRFLDKDGAPRELTLQGEEASFPTLVKSYSGDVPARAMLDEMIGTGVAEVRDGRICLLTRGYIVKKGDIDKLGILGVDVSELISTLHHNIVEAASADFLQSKVCYDNIPEETLAEVRKRVTEMATEFIESVDRLMSQYDRDVNPFVEGKGRKRAGLGVFYFE